MRLAPSRTVKISAGLVALAILVAAIGYFFLVKPVDAEAADAREETTELQQQLVSLKAQLEALQSRQNAVPEFYRLSKAAPVNVDVPGANLELLTLADRAGVDLQAFQTDEAKDIEGFVAPTFNITLRGEFSEVHAYLESLRTLVTVRGDTIRARGNLYRLDTFDIHPTDSESAVLEAVLTISITAPPAAETEESSGTAVSEGDAQEGDADQPDGDAAAPDDPDGGAQG